MHLRGYSCEEGQWFAGKKEMDHFQLEKVGLGGFPRALRQEGTTEMTKFYTYSPSSPPSPPQSFWFLDG